MDVLTAYGNSEGETPALDRLASRSLIFDFAFCESPDVADFYRAAWNGVHPACATRKNLLPFSLPNAVQGAGYTTALITEDPFIASWNGAGSFDETILVPVAMDRASDAQVRSPGPGPLGLSSADWLTTHRGMGGGGISDQPWFLWIHMGVLAHCWPDHRARDPVSYALDVEDLDADISFVLEALESTGTWDSTLLILAGCRGLSFGEHPPLGPVDRTLFEENIHIPLLMRAGNQYEIPARSAALVSVSDIGATIADWCGLAISDSHWSCGHSLMPFLSSDLTPWRDALLLVNHVGEMGIRTNDWYLRSMDAESKHPPLAEASAVVELYSKPDDRWDTNEISARCGEIVEGLLALRGQLLERLKV
ncbi:MAG: sulfatase-like hydrolase/transferase [Pirellulales bacterium]|nr:sulfatase-like hydrolase/transferase [Pirellulales bacterium]